MGESVASPSTATQSVVAAPPAAGTAGSSVAGVNGGGGTTTTTVAGATSVAPTTDLAVAIANLAIAINQLSAALQARQGAAGVLAGGPSSSTSNQIANGCGCGATTAPPAALPDSSPSTDSSSSADSTETVTQSTPAQEPTQTSTVTQTTASIEEIRAKIVATANAELARGVKENGGEDKDATGRIRTYRTAVTGAGEDPDAAEPWCADFASWVRKQAGVPFGKDGTGEDHTVAMVKYAKQEGTWHARAGYTPKPGDLVLFSFRGDSNVDHVAVVTKVANGRVYTIGGNEQDRVKASNYRLGDTRMVGYIAPPGG